MSEPERAEHYRYTDYASWPEDARCELIEGEVFDMSTAPNRYHQGLLMELSAQLHDHLRTRPCVVYPAPFDVRLPEPGESPGESSTVVQPDISVICDQEKLDDAGCIGAPDLLIEIVSPSTAAKDQLRKRRLYERHGVREFWIVHPTDRLIRVYRLGSDAVFGADEVYDATMSIESHVLEGFSFAVKDIFGG